MGDPLLLMDGMYFYAPIVSLDKKLYEYVY